MSAPRGEGEGELFQLAKRCPYGRESAKISQQKLSSSTCVTAPCKDSSIPRWKPSLREISFDSNTSLKAEFLNSFNFSLKNTQGESV